MPELAINVRGTNGSGKTTISHRLIDERPSRGVVEPKRVEGVTLAGQPYAKNFKKENAFILPGGSVCVGRYQAGMDGYLPHETITDSILHWAMKSEVKSLVFENVLLSGNMSPRWAALFDELQQVHGKYVVLATLDTPYEVCLQRIQGRREEARARGFKHRQADDALKVDAIKTHWKRVRRVAARAARVYDVRWVDHRCGYEQVHDLLVRAGQLQEPLLLPDHELRRWIPTDDELQHVIDTAFLPWETIPDGWVKPRKAKVTSAATPAVSTLSSAALIDDVGDPFAD